MGLSEIPKRLYFFLKGNNFLIFNVNTYEIQVVSLNVFIILLSYNYCLKYFISKKQNVIDLYILIENYLKDLLPDIELAGTGVIKQLKCTFVNGKILEEYARNVLTIVPGIGKNLNFTV